MFVHFATTLSSRALVYTNLATGLSLHEVHSSRLIMLINSHVTEITVYETSNRSVHASNSCN